MKMDPHSILKRARARVAQGWAKGGLVYPDGSVCALGAIAVASGWEKTGLYDDPGYRHLQLNGQRDAVMVLANIVKPDRNRLANGQDVVLRFNDSQADQKAVLKAFDKAIKATRPKRFRWLPW